MNKKPVIMSTCCALCGVLLYLFWSDLSRISWIRAQTKAGARKPSPLDPVSEFTPAASRRGIVLHWVAGDPTKRGRGKFTYYYDVANAFSHQKDVTICNEDIQTCFERAQASGDIYVPTFHHALTSGGAKAIEEWARNTARQLEAVLLTGNSMRKRCVSVVFMINKVYGNLHEKVRAFKTPFEEKNLSSSVDLLAFTWSPHALSWTKEFGFPFVWIPFAVDNERFNVSYRPWESRLCDVFIRWDTSPGKYRLRHQISEYLAKNKSESVSDINVQAPEVFVGEEKYLEAIRDCRMHLSTIGMPGRFDLIGTRYYEILASGASLLLVERAETADAIYAYEELGLRDGETVVMFSNLTELVAKIRYYKEDAAAAQSIILAAYALSRNHSWETRATHMAESIQRETTCPS